MKKSNLFSDKIFLKRLLTLTLPIALQSLMLASVAAADAIMLGTMEQNSMTAVSLAAKVQFLQNMVLSSTVSALIILGAQYWGRKDKKSLDDLFFIGLRLCTVFSVLFFALCEFFPRFVMTLFTNEETLIAIGAEYLKIAAWSYLLTGISQAYLALLKITEHAKQAAIISVVTVSLNIVLNAVFIYGLFGVPSMGVRGAALATLIARIVEVVWSSAISFGKRYFTPGIRGVFRHNRVLFRDFGITLLPLLGAGLLWSIGITSYAAFLGHLGEDAAAAYSVSSVVCELVCCMCNGIASGGGILVGNELGAGNLERGKEYGIRISKIGWICGFLTMLLVLLVTPPLLRFVKLTDQARTYLLQIMLVLSVYIVGRAVNTVMINGIFDSGGDTLFDTYSLAITMWGLAVPLAALGTFVFHWPPALVFAFTCLDEVGKIPWVMFHFRKYKWVKDLTRDNPDNPSSL